MRKIEKAMCEAVKSRKYFKSGNTEVNVRLDMYGMTHVEVRLHGNMIWRYSEAEDMTEFTLASRDTLTTRSRLRALGVDVCSKNKLSYCNGQMISKNKWYEVAK